MSKDIAGHTDVTVKECAMIRLLTQQDYDVVQSYLNQDPLHNIFMIHSLQTHGLESDLGTFWGTFDDDRLRGVLFADSDSRRRFGCLAADNPAASARLGQLALEAKVKLLLGKSTYVQPAIENLPSRIEIGIRHFNFIQIRPGQQWGRFYDHPVRAATEEDIPSLVELYRDWEYQRRNRSEEEIERGIRRVMDESGRYFLIEIEGQAVSAARVFPETDQAGMVDAARTLPAFRGQGMYPCVGTSCYEHLFRQGKTGVGFFEETNTTMARVITAKRRATIVARWLRVDLKERPPLRRRILPSRLRRWGLNIRDRVLRR
jgi:predicted GNAT family acetyltransferase